MKFQKWKKIDMRVIIAGSRDIVDFEIVKKAVDNSGFNINVVISGCARGVDTLGEQWANENYIQILKFPADWKTFGKRAGYRRNEQMAEHADALIAVWDGVSKGTKHMIDIARNKKLNVYVHMVQGLFNS